MKRILMLVVLLGALFAANAAGYNAKQEALISAIEKNLKEQSYSVERQDDGLKFKSEGVTYYIEVDKDETNPMYVRLCRYVKFDDKIKRDKVMKKLNDLNAKYAVKAYCKEKNVIFSAEMFVTTADQFNYAFNDMLSLIKSAYETIE
jgi:hypothetical protein